MSARRPPPPEPLERWCRSFGETAPETRGESLLEGAARALEAALRRPGRDRQGAHALLAADALLTWACEDAAGAADPEQALVHTLARVGSVARR